MQFKRLIFSVLAAVLFTGCLGTKGLRGKPGHVEAKTSASSASASQPENAKSPATVFLESENTWRIPVHAGDKLKVVSLPPASTNGAVAAAGSGLEAEFQFAHDTEFIYSSHDLAKASTGTAREDKAGEIAAKMKLGNNCLYIGAVVMLLGLALAFVPWLRALVGSTTFGLVLFLAGCGIAALPFLVIGNETQILLALGALLLAIGYYFVHRHGQLSHKAEIADKLLQSDNPFRKS